ncbi:MAG: ATP-binding protein, partial [Myxococcota bacterium]
LDDLRGVARVVGRASSRSVAIVGNLKNFARAPQEAVPADLHEGLDETLALLAGTIRHKSIHIVQDRAELAPVRCRAGEINQVFMNLLTNAVQAVSEEGTIRITTRMAPDNKVVLCFEDDGPGVPPAIAARIFDPFFTTKNRGEGTGLGLSISSEIMRRHGGRLALGKARDLGGAAFEVELPLEPASATMRSAAQ